MKTRVFAIGLASLSLAATAEAATINGEIHVTQFGSVALVDFSTNTVSFNPASNNAMVSFVSGDFAGLLGSTATYQSFRYDPLVVSNPIWSSSGGASFSLTSITSIDESVSLSALDLSGTGFLTLDGFDPTPGLWSFSADSNNSAFSFSSTSSAKSNVPDGGTTAALFGVALLGLHGARRKFASK